MKADHILHPKVLIFDTGGDGEQESQGPKGEDLKEQGEQGPPEPQAEFGPQGPDGQNKNSWRFTF